MEKKYLVVNIGSVSKKYAIYDKEKEIAKIHIEFDDNGNIIANYNNDSGYKKIDITEDDYNNSFKFFLELAIKNLIIDNTSEIKSIGIRIVAPNDSILETQEINDIYLGILKSTQKIVPLHITKTIEEIEKIKNEFPEITLFGVSDSLFYKNMPNVAKRYALPDNSPPNIKRYGYHGISMKSVCNSIKDFVGYVPKKTIICHLGGGVSITALKDGKSIDTSMGFSPSEGLPMSTRIGNIDAGAVIQIEKEMNLGEGANEFFNNECGLLGLSGKTSDIRKLISLEMDGDEKAKEALEYFVYSIKKCIGSYIAILGGLDMLIFTATIGERSFEIRSRVCKEMEYFGISLDKDKNNIESGPALVEDSRSKVKIAVIGTDEMKEIAKEIENID